MKFRILLGFVGIGLGLFGVYRLLTDIPGSDIVSLLVWLVLAVVLHDGVVAPVVALVGKGLDVLVPPRARRYVAYALAAAVGVVLIGGTEIYLAGTGQSTHLPKALLLEDYSAHLEIALGIIAAVAVLGYALSLVRGLRGPHARETNVRPPDDQVSSTE